MILHAWDYIAPYGWIITLGLFLVYFLYSKAVRPQLDQILEDLRVAEQKKFDEDVNLRIAERITLARQKQQEEHDRVAEEQKRIAEEMARKRLLELEERERKKTVLEATLLTHDLNAHKKAAVTTRSPAEIIDGFVASKPVVVFSKTWCSFCRKAKAALATFRLNSRHYEYIELDERTDLPGDEIQDEFEKRYGSRSVPKVFIGGELIGGGDDVVRLLHEGVLEVLINSAIGIRSKV